MVNPLKKNHPTTAAELERQIIEHPIRTSFHMKIGMLEMINENGESMMDALEDAAEAMLEFAVCVLIAFKHMLMICFYPATKMVLLLRLRRKVIDHPGLLRMVITDTTTEKK